MALATIQADILLGLDFTLEFWLQSAPDQPEPIAGWQLELVLQRWVGDAVSIPVTLTVADAQNGKVAGRATAAVIAAAKAAPLQQWFGIVRARPTVNDPWAAQLRVVATVRS